MTINDEECFGGKEQIVVSQPQDIYMLFFFSHGDLVKQVTISKDEYF